MAKNPQLSKPAQHWDTTWGFGPYLRYFYGIFGLAFSRVQTGLFVLIEKFQTAGAALNRHPKLAEIALHATLIAGRRRTRRRGC